MKNEIKLGVFAIVMLVVFGYFILKTDSCVKMFDCGPKYAINAHFDSVAELFSSAPVRMAGIKIGVVNRIELAGHQAVVEMLIDTKIKLTTDARAMVSTVGLVGEKYIEIVYKDEFKTEHPALIQNGGEIGIMQAFSMASLSDKLESLYKQVSGMTGAMHDLLTDEHAPGSLKAIFINLKEISDDVKGALSANGQIRNAYDSMNGIVTRFEQTLANTDHLLKAMSDALVGKDQGLMNELQRSAVKIEAILDDVHALTADLQQGKGSAGKLFKNDEMYAKIDDALKSVQQVLAGFNKTGKTISESALNYAVRFDYFSSQNKGRAALDVNLQSGHTVIETAVNENPGDGSANFTLMAGQKIAVFSLRAGMFESGLGAAIGFELVNKLLSLDIYGARLARPGAPLLRTALSFALGKNVRFTAAYNDFLLKANREFMIGLAFGN